MITFLKIFLNQYDAKGVIYTIDEVDLMACIQENKPWIHYVFANDWYIMLSNIIISNHLKGVVPMKDILALTNLNSKGINFLKTLAENDFYVCIE